MILPLSFPHNHKQHKPGRDDDRGKTIINVYPSFPLLLPFLSMHRKQSPNYDGELQDTTYLPTYLPEVGSSAKRRAGLVIVPQHNESLRFSPPDKPLSLIPPGNTPPICCCS